MTQPSTQVSRLGEKQSTSRDQLDELLDSTPLATVALVRDGHPVIFPTGFARVDDELVIHGSTGSPWMRALAGGASAAVSVTGLDGVVVARSGFESSFRYRSAVVFGVFEPVPDADKVRYLERLTEAFIPGRSAELRRQHPQGACGDAAAAAADRRAQLVAEDQRRLARRPRRGHRGRRMGGCRADVGHLRRTATRPRSAAGHPGARIGAGDDGCTAVSPVARCGGRDRRDGRRARRCSH